MGKVIKILAGLFIIIIIGVVIVVSTFDVNKYKPELSQAVEDATGRKLQIGGDIEFAISLIPTLVVEDVKFANSSWGSKPDMLSLGKFEVQVSLVPLLSGNIQVNRVILLAPEILLETNKKGVGNWIFASPTPKEEKEPAADTAPVDLTALAVNEVHIEKANVTYIDGITGKKTELLIDEITVDSSSFSDPMTLIVRASINQSPLKLDGTLGSINNLLDNKDYPVNIKANISGAEISLEGKLGQPLSAKGIALLTSLNINKLSDLNQMADSKLPETGPIIVNGKLSDTEAGYAFKSMSAQLMNYKVDGDMQIALSTTRPKLTANLESDALDISPFQGGEKEEVKKEKKEKVFPSDPLPLEGLKAVDVDLKFKTKKLITKDLTIDDTSLSLQLNNGKLQLFKQGKTAGGTISVKINLDASNGKSAALNTDIEVKQIELGQIPAMKEKNLLTGGKTDITIKAKGSGASVNEIMAGLNGKLQMITGKGQISSKAFDMASADALISTLSMLNPDANKQKGGTLECAVVNFNIKDGIATADNGIGLLTSRMNILGGGIINLKTEGLDIGFTPKAREGSGINLGKLAGLVRVGGTLANPTPKADTKAALSAGLAAGAAVATGGLSLLGQGAVGASGGDDGNPCDIALGKKPVQTKEASKEPEKSTTTKAVDSVKDAGSAVTDKVKGWFK